MAGPKLEVPYFEFRAQCARHVTIATALGSIAPELQRLVAELVMIRVFDGFQDALQGIATRIVCGAPYLDGACPNLLVSPARSTDAAVAMMRTHNRQRPTDLKWSKASYISDNVRHVVASGDHFTRTLGNHGAIIAEMQAVRNRIAHRNDNSRRAFNRVVVQRYGGNKNNVTPGLLLLTPRFQPRVLDEYIVSCRAIVKAAIKA